MVKAEGFEPPTSALQTRHSGLTELHPAVALAMAVSAKQDAFRYLFLQPRNAPPLPCGVTNVDFLIPAWVVEVYTYGVAFRATTTPLPFLLRYPSQD